MEQLKGEMPKTQAEDVLQHERELLKQAEHWLKQAVADGDEVETAYWTNVKERTEGFLKRYEFVGGNENDGATKRNL